MKYSLVAIILMCFFSQVVSQETKTQSFYSLQIDSIANNQKIDFANFKGKSVLIVVSAILDSNFSQILELRKLKERSTTPLVIILFPTNDFNNEPADNKKIAAFLERFHLPFLVAAKSNIKGSKANPVFQWIARQQVNGKAATTAKGTFQKYLVNQQGVLTDVFDPALRPTIQKNARESIEKTIKQ